MAHNARSATSWVAQSPERVARVQIRAGNLVIHTQEDHFRRLIAEWAQMDDGALPTRAQAAAEAQREIEILCRALGRLGALEPNEVFPRAVPATTPQDIEGW